MCFGLIVCLAIVIALWRKQRHGKREAVRTDADTTEEKAMPGQTEPRMKSFRLASLTSNDWKEIKGYAIVFGIAILAVVLAIILGMQFDNPTGNGKDVGRYRQKAHRIAALGAVARYGKAPKARTAGGLLGIASFALGEWLDHLADENRKAAAEEVRARKDECSD